MKIIQCILILLIFLNPYKANASRDNNSYDGNIFPIYAGNGAIVPPNTTLQESLKNKRVAVLFFYLDDSSDSKKMAPIISGLDLIWRNNIDIIALTTDELQDKEKSDFPNEPNYYWNGLIPQTIIINSDGEVKYDKNGMINIDELNNVVAELKGIEIKDTKFSLESFNEYNSIISEKTDRNKT
ncbi:MULTISPECIES: thylakoid membrane photosystem I accumulation factor [Prochlorococcus]|uniref:Thioredoxin family protein n=1 Tax=Prochlorococcus marinus str. MIT 9116 TaxID=167544 RepID=A0A0A1ZQ39_PROMR|nr:thylakoid membrane photosystem I accumulation factor [Prochlorococcus marinus]KGF89677.1 Thioredoxin family protein [Prochlorococcus marinus str. MIT 9107]KGF90313.1 Thioredoxin family protein [Prochlorococcus marinus str. MIT 9116]KGF92793.1 Thioredoxin family protein [Prochlorococcus marinus str. MIT 9123]